MLIDSGFEQHGDGYCTECGDYHSLYQVYDDWHIRYHYFCSGCLLQYVQEKYLQTINTRELNGALAMIQSGYRGFDRATFAEIRKDYRFITVFRPEDSRIDSDLLRLFQPIKYFNNDMRFRCWLSDVRCKRYVFLMFQTVPF